MIKITIRRVCYRSDATLGVMIHWNQPVLVTLEDPWDNNQTGISCIPAGTYRCVRHNSPHHPNTWEITQVPGRTDILIHIGNFPDDTEGCVLVGTQFGQQIGSPSILNSADGMNRLNELLQDVDEFELTVEHGGWGFN